MSLLPPQPGAAGNEPWEVAMVGVHGVCPPLLSPPLPRLGGAERDPTLAPPQLPWGGPGAAGPGRGGCPAPSGGRHGGCAPGGRRLPPCPAPAPAPARRPGTACSRAARRRGGGSCPNLPGPARGAAPAAGGVPAPGWGVLHPLPALSHAVTRCRELWVTPQLGMCPPGWTPWGDSPVGPRVPGLA